MMTPPKAGGRLRVVSFYGSQDHESNPHGLGLAMMEAETEYNQEAVCAGEWYHGKRHGRCMVTRPDCYRYLGDFTDDEFDGDGLLADFDKEIRQYGKFSCGHFVAGCVIRPKVIYEGPLDDDMKLNGQGFRQNIVGALSVGGFKAGKSHGVVFVRWPEKVESRQEPKQEQGR